mgnify:FL=1
MTTLTTTELLELTDDEKARIVAGLHALDDDSPHTRHLLGRLEVGEEYYNPLDEFVRTTDRKKRIEAEKKRLNERLETLTELLLQDFAEEGITGAKHAATGKTVSRSQRVWAKVAREGREATPEEKARAADALRAAGLGAYLEETFNVNSLSGHFSEQVKEWLADQAALPENERRPLDIDSFLPDPLKGAIELTNKPTLSVRS